MKKVPFFPYVMRICAFPNTPPGFCRSSRCSENPSLIGTLQTPEKALRIGGFTFSTITVGNNLVNCKNGCFPLLSRLFAVLEENESVVDLQGFRRSTTLCSPKEQIV